jgi:acyl carrier protein
MSAEKQPILGPEAILEAIAAEARAILGFTKSLTPELRLVEDLQLDSLRLLTLAMALEDRFRIALEEEEEAGIATVGDLVALVQRKLSEPEAFPA